MTRFRETVRSLLREQVLDAVDHLCAKMPRADITRWHYGRDDAEGRPLDHFRWIRHHHGLIERITAWASQVVAAQPSAR